MKYQPIAIVGMACKFPGANSLIEFWQRLLTGYDAIEEIPKERWNIEQYYDEFMGTPGKMYSRFGGFIHNLSGFDAEFFGINKRQANQLDPQQRLLLETSWQALEDTGISRSRLHELPVGVFVGIGSTDYSMMQIHDLNKEDLSAVDVYSITGNDLSIAANRISNFFGLQGPGMAINTGCSSSLVALDCACMSLQTEESALALVAGVNVIASPLANIALSQSWLLSAEGRCKSFSKDADGYVRSEGCGVVVLKRLQDAISDGDSIYAIVHGSSVNSNGCMSTEITQPNSMAQQHVISRALEYAGVNASEINFIEAHGVGTPAADQSEINTLHALYAKRENKDTCYVGAVKANIGHLEWASGMASLIKSALCLYYKQLPPQINYNNDVFDNSALKVNTEIISLAKNDKLYCGINSFGLGGTNAHVILSNVQNRRKTPESEAVITDRTFILSAHCIESLKNLATIYADYLTQCSEPEFNHLCNTLYYHRSRFSHQLQFSCSSAQEAREKLVSFCDNGALPENSLNECNYPEPERPALKGLPAYPFHYKGYWYRFEHKSSPNNDLKAQPGDSNQSVHAKEEGNWVQRVMATPKNQQESVLIGLMQQLVANILLVHDPAQVEADKEFIDLGFDSLLAIELKNKIQWQLGSSITLSNAIALDYGSIKALSRYVLSQIELNKESIERHVEQAIAHKDLKPFEVQLPINVYHDMRLSYGQTYIWLLRYDDRQRNSMTLKLEITGGLNVSALELALYSSSLENSAFWVNMNTHIPVQRPKSERHFNIHYNDISMFQEDKIKEQIASVFNLLKNKRTPYEESPQLCCYLLKTSELHHVLLISIPHIIGDMYSFSSFFQNVASRYTMIVKGTIQPVQFSDSIYYAFLEEELKSDYQKQIKKGYSFWKNYTKDATRIILPSLSALRKENASCESLNTKKGLKINLEPIVQIVKNYGCSIESVFAVVAAKLTAEITNKDVIYIWLFYSGRVGGTYEKLMVPLHKELIIRLSDVRKKSVKALCQQAVAEKNTVLHYKDLPRHVATSCYLENIQKNNVIFKYTRKYISSYFKKKWKACTLGTLDFKMYCVLLNEFITNRMLDMCSLFKKKHVRYVVVNLRAKQEPNINFLGCDIKNPEFFVGSAKEKNFHFIIEQRGDNLGFIYLKGPFCDEYNACLLERIKKILDKMLED